MLPRRDDSDSPQANAWWDVWYLLRLSSLECAVAVMLIFGVAASIVQPIIYSTRRSLASSVEQLDQVLCPARPDVPKTKTAARDRASV